MPPKVFSAAPIGVESSVVEVEVDIGRSLPSISIVGLPDVGVKEAKERVRAAIKNSGLHFPKTRVTVNLAPGNVRKEGPLYDLPIALAVLLASEELTLSPKALETSLFLGELALDGTLRPVRGVLSAALLVRRLGLRHIIVPAGNAAEAALVDGIAVLGATTLNEVVRHLVGEQSLMVTPPTNYESAALQDAGIDFAHIQGQDLSKRALEIAAAGGHNVRFTGPPGAGKTLLARAFTTILPPLTKEEVIDVTNIYSAAGLLVQEPFVSTRPFRSPHHTTSHVALVGGGPSPRPGEISLAHRGVLFLDEFLEFPRHALEALRQPLEDGVVTVARAAGTTMFPARFMLIAAENPCPCGFATDPKRECTCTSAQIAAYHRRVSGPLLDRIDLHVPVPRLSVGELTAEAVAESSSSVRERVLLARRTQQERFAGMRIITNAEMSSALVREHAQLSDQATSLLASAIERLHLSARAYYRTLKIARTIADLAGSSAVHETHLAEALQFRADEGKS